MNYLQRKSFYSNFSILLITWLFAQSASHEINKRFLIFPQSAPTRHQFIAGVGIPAELEEESLTVGYVFKAQYYLPYNVSMLHASTLIADFREKRNAFAISKKTKGFSRWNIYRILENVLERFGFNGPSSLLKTICEYASSPLVKRHTILEDLFHIFFLPSTAETEANIHQNEGTAYIQAETYGKLGMSCDEIYKGPHLSLFQLFSSTFQ